MDRECVDNEADEVQQRSCWLCRVNVSIHIYIPSKIHILKQAGPMMFHYKNYVIFLVEVHVEKAVAAVHNLLISHMAIGSDDVSGRWETLWPLSGQRPQT